MERIFIKVNENIETHIAAGKEERLLTLLRRTSGFSCGTNYKKARQEPQGTQIYFQLLGYLLS